MNSATAARPRRRPARTVAAGNAATLHVAEPLSAYARRPLLVVDTSVMASAVFGEERQPLALATLHARALNAPHLLDCEMTSVALRKLQRDGVPADRLAQAMQTYGEVDIARHAIDVQRTLLLAQRYRLSADDAAFLWLAEHLQAPLATFDDKLAEAARKHLTQESRPDEPA